MNLRFILTGLLMIALGVGFFVIMANNAHQSTDPGELLRTVGSVSGAVGALGLVVIVLGLFGVKFPR